MHLKEIKAIIKKQLKKEYPDWKLLSKKDKKTIARKVLGEVVSTYDFNQKVVTSEFDLLGIENQIIPRGIMNLEKMAGFVAKFHDDKLFPISASSKFKSNIKDDELRFIDNLLDNEIINRLLAYDGYTPAKRELFPYNLLRAELLKALKYPEISYRKFCSDEYFGRDRKQNREFMGLPLHRSLDISHSQLSQFRSSLTFRQMTNLMVYILHYFFSSGILGDRAIYCADSTELAIDNQQLLASIEIKGSKIRIYDDIDCDCGRRRKKRNKSVYVVGYRMHTLMAIDAETGASFPIISLLAPANHHDSNFLFPLAKLGKAVGVDIKLITADEAYNDKDGDLFHDIGVHLITPPGSKTKLPNNVDPETMAVTMNDMCETPMEYVGVFDKNHEFKCGSLDGECPQRFGDCPKCREIPVDSGHFQRIPYGSDEVKKAIDIRKNGERPFNLLKHREGLEPVRVRSRQNLLARCVFTNMATLLIEMANTRKKKRIEKKIDNKQTKLALAA